MFRGLLNGSLPWYQCLLLDLVHFYKNYERKMRVICIASSLKVGEKAKSLFCYLCYVLLFCQLSERTPKQKSSYKEPFLGSLRNSSHVPNSLIFAGGLWKTSTPPPPTDLITISSEGKFQSFEIMRLIPKI